MIEYTNKINSDSNIILGESNLPNNMCVTMNSITPPSDYILNTKILFSGKVRIGFNISPKSIPLSSCFSHENITPSIFYSIFNEYKENNQELTNPLNNVFAFKLNNYTWKFGDLSSYSWFNESGLTKMSYQKFNIQETITDVGTINSLYLFTFCDFGNSTVNIGSTNVSLTLNGGNDYNYQLLINSNPAANDTTTANWGLSKMWINNVKYNNPVFLFYVNPFSNEINISNLCSLPKQTKYELIETNSDEIFNMNTGAITLNRVIKITNPVLFVSIPTNPS